jgi:hypothetical protein
VNIGYTVLIYVFGNAKAMDCGRMLIMGHYFKLIQVNLEDSSFNFLHAILHSGAEI